MTKTEITAEVEKICSTFTDTCNAIAEADMFMRPDAGKWSVAENVQHLIISTNTSTLAYSLPKFFVRWIAGKPNRPSRSYDELKDKYYNKLQNGGVASSRFVPKPIDRSFGKQKLLISWKKTTAKFVSSLLKNRTEADLDKYLVKHPLLGRITLRELGYFTIFHTEHHLNSIKTLATKT